MLSHILNHQELKEMMEEVESLSMDEFSIHEWEKEKMDALVERESQKMYKEEGAGERNIEIAKKMLKKGMDIHEISEITEMSEDEIKKLKENLS